jgi:hypothetical protein
MKTLIFLSAACCAFSQNVRIYAECDTASEVRAQIGREAPLSVRYAITGGPVCYSVTATVEGKPVNGYLLDTTLSAVRTFEATRAKDEAESFARMPVAPPAPTPAKPEPVAASAPPKPKPADPAKPAAKPGLAGGRPGVSM